MVEVSAAILIKDGKILLAKRASHKHMGGLWEFPGGKIEDGETPRESLKRELEEEFGIVTLVENEFHQNIYNYPEKEIKLISFITKHVSGEFQINDHEDISWVIPEELSSYELAPADVPIAEKILNNLDIIKWSKEYMNL